MSRKSKESSSIELPFSSATATASATRSKFHNRTILVNRNMKKDKCRVFWISMHGGLCVEKNEHDKWVCESRPSPFNVMFRFIDAAPGEINAISDAYKEFHLYYNNPVLTNPNLTADMLATKLTEIGRQNFNRINQISVLFDPGKGKKKDTNVGRDQRYHKLINYHESPYCLKWLEYNNLYEVLRQDEETSGVILMEGDGRKINLLFRRSFMNWLSDKDPYQISWIPGKTRSGSPIVKGVTNEMVFLYIKQHMGIKNAFFIDSSCDYLEQLSLGHDPSIADAVAFLTRADYKHSLIMQQNKLGMTIKTMKDEEKDITNELAEYQQLTEELEFLNDLKMDTMQLTRDYQFVSQRIVLDRDMDSKTRQANETYLNKIDKFIRAKLQESPIVADLIDFQSASKQNEHRWHVVQKGYTRFR